MTWREAAQRRIQKVVDEVGLNDQKQLKQALFDAYPYGERKHYPYKVWCQEVRKILNQKPAFKPLPKNNLFGIEQ